MALMVRRVVPLLVILLVAQRASGVLAQTPPSSAAPARTALPKLASTVLPPPDPAQLAELDKALAKFLSAKDDERKEGLLQIKEGGVAWLPAMSRRLGELRKSANREAMATMIDDARKHGRKMRKGNRPEGDDKPDQKKKKPKKDPSDTNDKSDGANDWLGLVTLNAQPSNPVYRDLVTILALERGWVEIGTTAAVRDLVNVYVYFGDLFRVDVQHMIERLGDRAVPALLEAKKHDAEKVRRWASKQLDTLGRAIPGEAVQVTDPVVLADVLRAYGRTKDIEALRPLVSFASSDRVQIRDAAREAVCSYGEAALWQLREAYETLTGQRPPPGATWDKIATDLFGVHDRARLAEVYTLFDEGLAAYREKKLEEMAAAFDKVLARAPTFERRNEMAAGYYELAQSVESKGIDQSLLYARKALRLAPDAPDAKKLESYILTLEGEQQVNAGLADTVPFKRAIEVDPNNDRARRDLQRVEQNLQVRSAPGYRYLAAAVVGAIGALAALIVGFWRARPDDSQPAPKAPIPTTPMPISPPESDAAPVNAPLIRNERIESVPDEVEPPKDPSTPAES